MISSKERLFGEISKLAYHFHWTLDDILDLDHAARALFLAQADRLSQGSGR